MLDLSARQLFLQNAGWAGATEHTVGEDWSQRQIMRLGLNGKSAILMHSLPENDPRLTPGHKPGDYVRIAAYLRGLGLSAPEIYAADPAQGLLLVEDFGPLTVSDLIEEQAGTEMLYQAATDVLIHLYKTTADSEIGLPDYYKGHIHTARRRIIDWYTPAIRNQKNEDGLAEAYLKVWDEIEQDLPPVMQRFLHVDFHPQNLVWLEDRSGVARVGLLDFQGAMRGPAPYDLANLLLGARCLVPGDLQAMCLERFKKALPVEDWGTFSSWYQVLACQFHCRVIGQAIRLAVKENKTRLLALIPTLQTHLRNDLLHPGLRPLADFFRENGVDLSCAPVLNVDALRTLVREDAF